MRGDLPRILLTGSTGQIGGELRAALADVGVVSAPTHAELDLTHAQAIRDVISAVRPDVLVNAAGYTAVDLAEQDVDRCAAINAAAPGVLAEEMARLGGLLVHYSTDYVFDGTSHRPYAETDACFPLNVYGRTKLEGERAIAAVGGRHLVLRTSWVYGLRGSNFLRTIRRLARERSEIRVVNDQTGSPTWSRSVAAATAALIARALAARDDAAIHGTYHLSSSGVATWWAFAEAIVQHDRDRGSASSTRVIPIRSEEFPTAARRPAYSVLDTTKIRARHDIVMPDWRTDLARVFAETAAQPLDSAR